MFAARWRQAGKISKNHWRVGGSVLGLLGKEIPSPKNRPTKIMKLILSACCATLIVSPFAFAGGECDGGECPGKIEEATVAGGKDCGECDGGEVIEEESTVAGGKDCGECDGGEVIEEESTIIAHCGSCNGEEEEHEHKEEEKVEEEGTVLS